MDPILVTKVEKGPSDAPLLIIDKEGSIGHAIYDRIKNELLVVLVSSKQPEQTQNLIYIPYKNHIPEIPNDVYSLIIFISQHEKDRNDITKQFIAKAKQDNIKFVFITAYDKLDVEFIEKTHVSYEESYALILGELFGNETEMSHVDKYIYQAATTGTIKLPHMGLRKTRPVLFDDAIQAILQSIFGIQSQHRIIYLYQQHAYTDLSIAHILQKIDPLVHVDFLKDDKKSVKASLESEQVKHIPGHYYFDREYPLTTKIAEIYKSLESLKESKVDAYVYKEELAPLIDLDEGSSFGLPEPIKKIGGYIFYCLCVVMLIPVLILSISLLSGTNALHVGEHALSLGDIAEAKRDMGIAATSFMFADLSKDPVIFALHIVKAEDVAQKLSQTIATGRGVAQGLQNLLSAGIGVRQVTSGAAPDPASTLGNAVSMAEDALLSLQRISTDSVSDKALLAGVTAFQKEVDISSGILKLLPQVVGIHTKKTYLLVFTSNVTLRPGGGYIGSYGLLTFDNGKMGDITIHDVTDVDNQLRQHVDPPFALRRYAGIMHQYIRDSNFDVDFANDARTTAQMFQLATGQQVDGIISLDLTAIRYLLDATGPISLSSSNTIIDKDNLMLLVEENAQKKGFLQSIYTALEKKLLEQQHIDPDKLTQALLQSIEEKHMMIALSDVTSQNILTTMKVSSSLWDSRTEDSGDINDFMGIVDANLGQNDANFFVQRNIKQSISIDGDGTLNGQIDVQYHNGTPATQVGGGDYKDYMRVMLPKDAVLTGIAFDDKQQATRSAITDPFIYEAKGFTPPHALEIEQTEEYGKAIYGFPVIIPSAATKNVTITYIYTKKINLASPVLHYNLRLFKQPGTDTDPFVFSLNYPLEYSLLSSSPPSAIDSTSDYSLLTQLSQDKTITVDLTKK